MTLKFLLSALSCFYFVGLIACGNEWDEAVAGLDRDLGLLGQQLIMQRLAFEESTRSDGDSGVKSIRLQAKATNPFMTNSYTRKSNSAIHDHSNNIRTVGMGEVIAVLNGVEFRTRHNDFRLYMRDPEAHQSAIKNIPFPDVPPEVTSKGNVADEMTEMQEWFRAFKEQDHSVRDYRKYFKPILCYMEGAWTMPKSDAIVEPFASDRHQIDASSWFDLQQKIRFTSSTGTKSNLENFAFLPTTIASMSNISDPQISQWNYRIMCHPLKRDVPLNRFKLVDDFASRMVTQFTMAQQELSRGARYILNPFDSDEWPTKETNFNSSFLDDLMYEIPGWDNYYADITDDTYGSPIMRPDGTPLNAGFYHRTFKADKNGEDDYINRGFNDQNFWVALTTNPEVMPLSYSSCHNDKGNQVCKRITQRATYSFPLEIIYLTPLYQWNPHGIAYRGNVGEDDAKLVKANGRNGQPTKKLAYDGTHSKLYYRTPKEFFGGSDINRDAADTSASSVAVLGSDGEPKIVSASGTRIFLPSIADLGNLRMRYPINPVHDEGSVTRKELEAIKKAFLELSSHKDMLRVPLDEKEPAYSGEFMLETGLSTVDNVEPHKHTVAVSTPDWKALLYDGYAMVTSSEAEGHTHLIKLIYLRTEKVYKIRLCDNKWICADRHDKVLIPVQSS